LSLRVCGEESLQVIPVPEIALREEEVNLQYGKSESEVK